MVALSMPTRTQVFVKDMANLTQFSVHGKALLRDLLATLDDQQQLSICVDLAFPATQATSNHVEDHSHACPEPLWSCTASDVQENPQLTDDGQQYAVN
jgi:hypothetical protein